MQDRRETSWVNIAEIPFWLLFLRINQCLFTPFLFYEVCVIVYLKRTMTLSSSLSISSSLDSLLPALSYKNLLSILVLLDNI